jgi:hypothetical protein
MKCNQESHRSLFLQYDLPTSLTFPKAKAITLYRLIHRRSRTHPTQWQQIVAGPAIRSGDHMSYR